MDEPAGLGERGSRIFQAMGAGVSDPARLALITEAARTADRLDELDNIIQGKGVLNLMQFRLMEVDWDRGELSVEVKFNAILAEARQQQTAFANVLKAAGLGVAEVAAPPVPEAQPETGADMLEQRRKAREAKSS